MSLKARVGRHAATGVQCQNRIEDQYAIITVLSLIPVADGGNGGTIVGRVLNGISSDALYQAILRFQKRHFPSQQTGFIEPNGTAYAKMVSLASKPVAIAEPKGKWNEFKSGSIPRALRAGLADDRLLSHLEVVGLIRSAFKNGVLSAAELSDISMVTEKAESILPRSKAMLQLLVSEASSKIANLGPCRTTSIKQDFAVNLVCDFLGRTGSGVWPNLNRDIVGIGMLLRIAYPGLIGQGGSSLCGPAAMLFNILNDNPGQYAKFAIELFERGEGKIRNINVKPKGDIFGHKPNALEIHQTDWFTLASIRDSENWILDYDEVGTQVGGITTPMEMAHWFSRAGYSDVREDANFLEHRGVAGIRGFTDVVNETSRLFVAGYRVCLLIDGQMVGSPTLATDTKPAVAEPHKVSGSKLLVDRHWVVLRSRIDRTGGNVKFTVFTWGDGNHQVPQAGIMSLDQFYENFYGYVAAKP